MNKQGKNYISKASNKMVGLVLARKQKKKRKCNFSDKTRKCRKNF